MGGLHILILRRGRNEIICTVRLSEMANDEVFTQAVEYLLGRQVKVSVNIQQCQAIQALDQLPRNCGGVCF